MLKRPPVPKFHEECNTPKRNQDMYCQVNVQQIFYYSASKLFFLILILKYKDRSLSQIQQYVAIYFYLIKLKYFNQKLCQLIFNINQVEILTQQYELISDIIFKMNLNAEVEQKSISIFNVLSIPNSYMHAQAIVYYAMKELQYKLPETDEKLQHLAKCIQQQHSTLITTLCQKLKIDSKATTVCVTLLRQMQPLIQKLPKPVQNAIVVKIATDIIYLKQDGININLIANSANITTEQLHSNINRIKPFAFQIIQNLFNYFNHHSI